MWVRITFLPFSIEVCVKIEVKIGRNNEKDKGYFSPEWTLGSCYGPHHEYPYERYPFQSDLCCLSPGRHTLTCINKKSELGWGNVMFKIDEKRYCDDFVGFKAMRTILIEGKIYASTFKHYQEL